MKYTFYLAAVVGVGLLAACAGAPTGPSRSPGIGARDVVP